MKAAQGGPSSDHFFRLVRHWSNFGPPLCPWPADTAVVQRVIAGLKPGGRAVVLGLTPETVGCDWPEGTRLFAIDHSEAMIGALWPSSRKPAGASANRGAWQRLPFSTGSVDLVAADGCSTQFPSLDAFTPVLSEVRRVLRPGGLFVTRIFLSPDSAESLDEIGRALSAGEIGSVHALKLRLWAALHGTSGEGTLLEDVWRAWRALPKAPPSAPAARGWTEGELEGIEGYRGLQPRYSMPGFA